MSMIRSILESSRKHISNLKQFKQVCIVLGNESCDLDSAISSLVYSVLLEHKKPLNSIVFPVLNIPRIQLSVKTELIYFLKRNDIDVDSLICKDEIDLHNLHKEGRLQLTLVDHHVLEGDFKQFSDSVVTVIDHRPQDPCWLWPHVDLTLQRVGSCCTLVAERFFSQAPKLLTPDIALLLLGVIIVDTNVFSSTAGLATAKDIEIADQLESRCNKIIDRNKLFDELQSAKKDISSLTSAQLLIKDLKVTGRIPIAGFPIKVQQFLLRNDAISAIKELCLKFETDLCVLYGMEATSECITRDLAIYSNKPNSLLALRLVTALKENKDPDLKLQPVSCSLEGVILFEQLNIKATRKQILPIVRKIGEEYEHTLT